MNEVRSAPPRRIERSEKTRTTLIKSVFEVKWIVFLNEYARKNTNFDNIERFNVLNSHRLLSNRTFEVEKGMASEDKIAALREFRQKIEGQGEYEVLGLSRGCDDSAVRAAYFACLKKYGADFFHGSDESVMEDVNYVNKRLRDAYDRLQTQEKRDAYDSISATGGGDKVSSEAGQEPIDFASVFEGEQALSRARALLERGEFVMAMKNLETALKSDPDSPEIAARLAYAQFMLLDVDKSGKRSRTRVDETRRVLASSAAALPNADYIPFYEGEVEKLDGNESKALEFFRAAYEISKSPLAQREIHLMESRLERAKLQKSASGGDQPKSLIDQVKELFGGLFGKK